MRSTSWGSRRGSSARSTSWGRRGGGQLVAGLVAVLAAAGAAPASALAAPNAVTTEVVVSGPGAVATARAAGVRDLRTAGLPHVAVARVTPAQAAALARAGLRVAPDRPVVLDAAGGRRPEPDLGPRLSVAQLTGADQLAARGEGVTIAVVDSGVAAVPGLAGRVVQGADFTGEGMADRYGHGTFVAGLAAGDGTGADGTSTGIVGVAPRARVLSVKVADARGRSSVGRLVLGIAWVIAHRDAYGVDVLNLSLSAHGDTSYDYNPVDALVEAAWFSGITVVASAGNDGRAAVRSAPGNDPYVVTVGSVADGNTAGVRDDDRSPFSNSGTTADGFAKPEVTSFGQHVQSTLPQGSVLAGAQTVAGLPAGYGQLSGTSMSTGVVSGMVAVMESAAPGLSPDQAKGRLVATRSKRLKEAQLADAVAATGGDGVNAGHRPSIALFAAYAQLFEGTTDYASVDYGHVDWYAVSWTDATWTDATWTDATWTDATWTDGGWTNATWTDATWTDATWTNAVWTDGLR